MERGSAEDVPGGAGPLGGELLWAFFGQWVFSSLVGLGNGSKGREGSGALP